MPRVSALPGTNPADRTVVGPSTDKPTRTGASLSFRHLLRQPRVGLLPAFGPAVRGDHLKAAETRTEAAPCDAEASPRRHSDGDGEPELRPPAEAVLDPLFCQLALNQGPTSLVQPNPAACPAPATLPLREDLQNLLTGLARRTAWGGDRRKGSARIELSVGSLAGATLVVHTEQRSVRVELELPPGLAAPGWQQRITERLEARGFAARVKVG